MKDGLKLFILLQSLHNKMPAQLYTPLASKNSNGAYCELCSEVQWKLNHKNHASPNTAGLSSYIYMYYSTFILILPLSGIGN